MTALSSSEGSLYSTCCQSGSDDESADDQLADLSVDAYGHLRFPSQAAASPSGPVNSSWYSNRTPSVTRMTMMKRSNGPESADSVYNTLQAAVRKINTPEREVIKEQPAATPVNKKPAVSSRQELRKRLQEVKLTSESGNASVIEVIEPSSSEDEGALMMTRPPQDQSTPLRSGGNARSFNASFSEELEKARQNKNNRLGLLESPATSKSSDTLTKALLAEPDLLAGTVATASASRSCHDLALIEQEDDVNPSTRSHSSLSSSNNTAVTLIPRKKSGGFLTKFALKARWPSKRKTPTESLTASESTAVSDGGGDDLSQQQDGTGSDEPMSPGGGSNASGVVAGLSQMFEDMSALSIKASSTGMMEKRSGSQLGPSRSNVGEAQQQAGQGAEEEQMDLPPSTSPPPVPLEIETYNSMSPPSSQNASSSSSASCGGAPQPMPPPPPPRCGSELNKATTPSSSASSSTSASHGGVESLSVAASEDSGIVMARPASSASKSDSSPRAAATTTTVASAGSSASAYAYATYSPLRCKTATVLDSAERLSPAPSDMSKAESATTSDLSKTESMRHFRQLARIEESAVATAAVAVEEIIQVPAPEKQMDVEDTRRQSGQILTWREAKLKNQVVTPPPLEERLNKVNLNCPFKTLSSFFFYNPILTCRHE